MTKEALKLALEALENLHDENMDYLVRNKLGGENNQCMVFARDVIKSIKRILAQPEPDWTPERIAGMARLKEAQDKKLAHPEQEYHAVNAVHKGQQCYVKTQPKEPEQKPMHPQLKAMLEEYFDKCFAESAPQRTWVGLTDEEYAKLAEEFGPFPINEIEAKLKEKNT